MNDKSSKKEDNELATHHRTLTNNLCVTIKPSKRGGIHPVLKVKHL